MAIRLNGIFKDNLVFQWGAEFRIFGTCDSVRTIRCDLIKDGKTVLTGVAGTEDDGSFLVCVDPTDEPGGPYELAVYEDDQEQIRLKNCYAGEVWLAAGQRNMEYPLARTEFAKYIIPKIGKTEIRLYDVPKAGFLDDDQAKAEEESQWVEISSENAGRMSGIAYYFAHSLEVRLDSKIGIITCCFGASTIDCWQSVDSLKETKEGRLYIKGFDEAAASLTDSEYDQYQREYEVNKTVYDNMIRESLKYDPYMTYLEADMKFGPEPWPPPVGLRAVRHPGSFFECMILRIAPYTLRGVIFYQGEADAADGYQNEYGPVFKTLIREWREVFFDEELPFLFCQLPMFISKERKYMGYDDMSWPVIREQQQIVAIDLPNVYMAVIADCGEFNNLHPADKKTPGDRLALLAQKFVYGFENVDAVAPYIVDARRGEGVEITFGGDYMLLNIATDYGGNESGFEVAGEDGEFYPADAAVDFDGKTVLLSCPEVEFPAKVRYAYFSYGPTPLHAQNGLTATPFQVSLDKDLGME